jgi:hypothetical protein
MTPAGDALDIYLLTFNCARNQIDPESFAPHFFHTLPSGSPLPDIIAISLQEVAPIAYSFLGGSYLTPYFDLVAETVALASAEKGDNAKDKDNVYVNLLTRNVGMTALMLFVKSAMTDRIQRIQTAGAGVGFWRMGNKGAVGARIGVSNAVGGHVELTFVAAHLAPMEWNVKRRNWDYEQIVRNLGFTEEAASRTHTGHDPSRDFGEDEETESLLHTANSLLQDSNDKRFGPKGLYESAGHLFVFGDLNYRTSDVAPGEKSFLAYPQPSYSLNSEKHFLKFLQRDQLKRELEAQVVFHGFEELPISFPPTYKYSNKRVIAETLDSGPLEEADYWPWAKHRFPSWCDRILYYPSIDLEPHLYSALPVQWTSDHRPVSLSAIIKIASGNPPIFKPTPFRVNPEYANQRATARTRELAVAVLSYISLTGEGQTVFMALFTGAVAGWYLLYSVL